MIDKNNTTKDYFNNEKEWFVSLVIPTINRQDILLGLIEMISNQIVLPKEIFIFDQSDDINIDKDALFKFKNLNLKYYMLNRKNKQTALNWGLRLSKYPIFINIDDDVIIDEYFILNHLIGLKEHGTNIISGASIREGCDYIDKRPLSQFWEPAQDTYLTLPPLKKTYNTVMINGNNASFKKNILMDIGGWDDQLGELHEDSDLSMVCFFLGERVVYDPRPKAFVRKLKGGWSHKNYIEPRLGLIYFFRKHFSKGNALISTLFHVIKGKNLRDKYSFTLFLTTPVRALNAIKNWIYATKLLKEGPNTIEKKQLGNLSLYFESKKIIN